MTTTSITQAKVPDLSITENENKLVGAAIKVTKICKYSTCISAVGSMGAALVGLPDLSLKVAEFTFASGGLWLFANVSKVFIEERANSRFASVK